MKGKKSTLFGVGSKKPTTVPKGEVTLPTKDQERRANEEKGWTDKIIAILNENSESKD